MLWRRQSSLVKLLEPSSWAAFLDGPNTLMPATLNPSDMPATNANVSLAMPLVPPLRELSQEELVKAR